MAVARRSSAICASAAGICSDVLSSDISRLEMIGAVVDVLNVLIGHLPSWHLSYGRLLSPNCLI